MTSGAFKKLKLYIGFLSFNIDSFCLYNFKLEDVIFLDTYQPKDNVLKNYANTGYWWIEDNITNAIVGKSLGLQSILFRNNAEGLASVSTWKELYWKIIEHE